MLATTGVTLLVSLPLVFLNSFQYELQFPQLFYIFFTKFLVLDNADLSSALVPEQREGIGGKFAKQTS